MFEVAIIKCKRGFGNQSAKIKKFDNLQAAQKFVNEFNSEDKEIPPTFEYATIIVNY